MTLSVENALAAELPRLLAWRNGLVGRMAQEIHAACDWKALPLLADALEDAGCTVPEVLEHLRAGSWHHGFCFVVSAIRHAETCTEKPV